MDAPCLVHVNVWTAQRLAFHREAGIITDAMLQRSSVAYLTSGSASNAWMSARASALPHARDPMASATGRPSRPTRNVVGRPITPYALDISPPGSTTSEKVRPNSLAYG